jgi:hypothetical protein
MTEQDQINNMAIYESTKTSGDEKDHVEVSSISSKNQDGVGEEVEPKGDYSGAAAKTDPVEIRLVRKLDRRLLVGFAPLNLNCH